MSDRRIEGAGVRSGLESQAGQQSSSAPLLKVSDVSVSYGEILALKNIFLEIRHGEIIALLGSNGAGKSTMINAISGLVAIKSGRIEFNGTEIHRTSCRDRFRLGIGISPEGRRVFPTMSVEENLMVGAQALRSLRKASEDFDFVYEIFPKLKERRRQVSGTLSGGEQQMLAIGRALMGRPKLLLMDEPSLGMAPIIIEQVLGVSRLLRNRGISILLAEQNAGTALALADRAYMLSLGTVSDSRNASDINAGELTSAYFGG